MSLTDLATEMQFDGSLGSYWAIIEWMKASGNTSALANEVVFKTGLVIWPGAIRYEAARVGEWIIRDGDQFAPATSRRPDGLAASHPTPARFTVR